MKNIHATEPELLERAAEWFVRVRNADGSSEDHAAWLAWIEADPAHRAAFTQIQEAWDVAGVIESPPWPRPVELAEGSRRPEISGNRDGSPHATTSAPGHTRAPPRIVWATLAASVVIFAGVLLLARFGDQASQFFKVAVSTERIATGRGEHHSAVLPDGSRIELGGLTAVAVTYTGSRRLVVAEEGEAFYRIEDDPKRPFVVQAGPVSVTAVGTAFSVRREGESVSVVVTEGVVEVNSNLSWRATVKGQESAHASAGPVRARAGERVRYNNGEVSPSIEPVETELAAAWRRGRLRFENEPLRVVVASLNRYSMREIVIGDPALTELRFTGTVFDDRVEDWLEGVQVVFPVRLREVDPHRVVIEPVSSAAQVARP